MAVITLGGNVGAGKSHISGKLAGVLGYEEFNVSTFFRDMAAKEGLSIDEFYFRLKNNPELELSVDRKQAGFFQRKNNVVVQGRLAWHFAKESPFPVLNVFLALDPAAVAARIGARSEYEGKTPEVLVQMAMAREAEERSRYRTLYGIENHLDHNHYDLVLDTTHLTPEEVVALILNRIKNGGLES